MTTLFWGAKSTTAPVKMTMMTTKITAPVAGTVAPRGSSAELKVEITRLSLVPTPVPGGRRRALSFF